MPRRETFLDRHKARARAHGQQNKSPSPLKGWFGPIWFGIPAYIWILAGVIVFSGLYF